MKYRYGELKGKIEEISINKYLNNSTYISTFKQIQIELYYEIKAHSTLLSAVYL